MIKASLGFCTLLLLVYPHARAADVAFESGQIWTYKTRPTEPDSRIIINRVDDCPPIGRIVHVSITHLRVRRSSSAAPEPWRVGHAPFAEALLRQNVQTLETSTSSAAGADFEESYAQWEEKTKQGKVEHWTIPPLAVIRQIEKWVLQHKK
jgi:hypothetical protein